MSRYKLVVRDPATVASTVAGSLGQGASKVEVEPQHGIDVNGNAVVMAYGVWVEYPALNGGKS